MMTAISGILACHTIQMSAGRRLLGYVLRYRRDFSLGFLCVIATATVTLAGPWVLKYAVDDLARGVDAGKLWFYGLALLALAAIGGVFRFLMRRIIIGASRGVEYDLATSSSPTSSGSISAYFQQHRTGDLMSRATSDLNAVRMMIGPAVMYPTTTGLTFIVAIALMISIDPWLTLHLPDAAAVRLASRWRYFGNAIHRRFESHPGAALRDQRHDAGDVVRRARRAGLRPGALRDRAIQRRQRGVRQAQQGADSYPGAVLSRCMGLLMGMGALLVLWLGSREVVAGRITVGELVAFNAYLTMLDVADDRLRLGDEPPAARHGVVEVACWRCSTPSRA